MTAGSVALAGDSVMVTVGTATFPDSDTITAVSQCVPLLPVHLNLTAQAAWVHLHLVAEHHLLTA
jgi:hypothetical protein